MTLRIVALALWVFVTSARADVWVSSPQGVHKLTPDLTAIALSVPAVSAMQIGVDPRDKGLWILGATTVSRRLANGSLDFEKSLSSLDMQGAAYLAIDGRDGSIWLAQSGGSAASSPRGILHLSDRGLPLLRINAPSQVAGLAVGLDQTLAVLGNKRLFRYTPAGALSGEIDLQPFADGESRLVQVDAIGGWMWVAGDRKLLRVDPAATYVSAPFSMPTAVGAIALDQAAGPLFVLTANAIFSIDERGAIAGPTALAPPAVDIAYDPVTQTLVVAKGDGVAKVARGSNGIVSVDLGVRIEHIGVEPLVVTASPVVLSPVNGSVGRDPKPPLRVKIDSRCSTMACPFDASVYRASALAATLDGASMPLPFAFDEPSSTFTATPQAPLSEGTHRLQVTVNNPYGPTSSPADALFSVDTTPPKFLELAPQSPFATNQSTVTISGRVNEPATVIVGGQAALVSPDGAFTVVRPVSVGLNSIAISATDLAGNATSATVTVMQDLVPPQFGNVQPIDGSTTPSAIVLVTGTVSEQALISVSNEGVTQSTTGTSFSFTVTLREGLNTITLAAKDAAGNETTVLVHVTRGGALQLRVSSPIEGALIDGGRVFVTGQVSGADGIRVSIGGAAAELFGADFVGEVNLVPGANIIEIKAVADSGASTIKALTVNSSATGRFEPSISPGTLYAPAMVLMAVPKGIQASIDFDGDGFVDASGAGPQELSYWIYTPGLYRARATITDSLGTYTREIPFVVADVPSTDQKLRQLFQSMLSRLRAGDVEGAVSYFTRGTAERYRRAFEELRPMLATVADQIGTLVEGTISETSAEYLVVQLIDGKRMGFFIYFARDGDGIWRINQL